jgi:hypothetical protein
MDCSSHQPKLVATGISPLGIVSVGVVPMGIIAIGVVPMGVISLGVVSMGVITAGFTTMGLIWGGMAGMGPIQVGGQSHQAEAPLMFATQQEAEARAREMGCVGAHPHGPGGQQWMPCSTMEQFLEVHSGGHTHH